MIRKMSEVMQKQRNQSLNKQKQLSKGIPKKDVLKCAASLQENPYAEV